VALLHVFCYPHGTMIQFLLIPFDTPLILRAYSDVGWEDDPDIHCSTTGFYIILELSLIF